MPKPQRPCPDAHMVCSTTARGRQEWWCGPMPTCPGAVLDQLRAGHQRFLDGHSLHPHSDRLRMLEVEAGQSPVAAVLGCAD